jgi:hypothetical protein
MYSSLPRSGNAPHKASSGRLVPGTFGGLFQNFGSFPFPSLFLPSQRYPNRCFRDADRQAVAFPRGKIEIWKQEVKDQFFADYLERLEDLQYKLQKEVQDLPADVVDWSPGPDNEIRGSATGPYYRLAQGGDRYRPGRP